MWLPFKFSFIIQHLKVTAVLRCQCTVANTCAVNIIAHTYIGNIYSASKDALHISTHLYIINYCVLLEHLCGKIVNKICLVTD